MPNVSDLKNSKHLTKEDFTLEGQVVTIKSWTREDVSRDDQPEAMKYILMFNELDKGLALNVTNGNRIAKITGTAEFDEWIGHKVVLYHDDMVEMRGEIVGGIRVRKPKNTIQQAADEATAAHETKLQDRKDDAEAEQTY